MITNDRLFEIEEQLEEAGDQWVPVARALPEYTRHSEGKPAGPGLHRPWVLLHGQQEWAGAGVPVRLVRFDDGAWLLKGQRQGVV